VQINIFICTGRAGGGPSEGSLSPTPFAKVCPIRIRAYESQILQKVPLVGQTPVDRRTARLAPGRGLDTGCYRDPACVGEHEECSRACRRISRVVASVEARALRAPRPPSTWLVPRWSASNTVSTGRGVPHTARGVFPPASRARGCVPRARLRVELGEVCSTSASVGRGRRPPSPTTIIPRILPSSLDPWFTLDEG
jgi:hypothetical protein